MVFKSWWQWSQIKLETVSIPLVELIWHRPLSFPTVTLIWILSGAGQNRCAINHSGSLVRVGGIHTTFTMKKRLQFYSHGLLQISQEQEHRCGCHYFFLLCTGCKYKMWALLKSNTSHHGDNTTQILCWEKEPGRIHSKLKDIKSILEYIMLKETNSHYFE